MNEVWELDRVLDEECRYVVARQVPVSLFRVETNGKAARVALGVGRTALTANGGETNEYLGPLAHCTEQLCLRELRDVVRDCEGAVGAGALGVHHSLWDALAIEMLELLDEVEVLQQQWSARTGGDRVL